MSNLRNNVQLMGRLGRAPEVTSFDNGNKIARFSLAINSSYRDKSGEYVEKTTWSNIVVWGKMADVVATKLDKGVEIMLSGRLENREYNAKDGSKRHISEVILESYVDLSRSKQTANKN